MTTRSRTTAIPIVSAWHLAENATMRLPRSRTATIVRAERGTVLVTQAGDRDDHVLEPGDELVVPRGGVAVAWAFTDAAISVRDVAPASSTLDRLPRHGGGAPRAPGRAAARELRVAVMPEPDEASEAVARAANLEQIGARVAHELKNPLTGVKALVQLGLRNPAENPSHERLAALEREITRMQEILQGYLSSIRQEVSPTRVELGPLVSEALRILSARADEACVRLLARGNATVQADPRRIEEALLNLVANGIEATPPGGEVVVEVRSGDDGAEIVVRDTGRGMSPEVLRRLGTPFFTTREDGTGLGVVLTRSAFALHGGSVGYESQPGRGTIVRATLPARTTAGPHDTPPGREG